MKSVGQLLRETRLQKQLTLKQISQTTKIRLDYLSDLEKDQFDRLPSATFTKGFIRNYALAVGLNPDTALAIFRRDFDQNRQGRIIPRGFTHPLQTASRFFHPRTTTFVIFILVLLLVAIYTVSQILTYTQAPDIILYTPSTDVVAHTMVEVSGKTASDATLTINNQPISLDSNGQFSTTLNLEPGDHTLVIQAQSRDGKTRTITRFITVSPPTP